MPFLMYVLSPETDWKERVREVLTRWHNLSLEAADYSSFVAKVNLSLANKFIPSAAETCCTKQGYPARTHHYFMDSSTDSQAKSIEQRAVNQASG